MALINCPECNHMVSDMAFQCPQCAFPIKQNIIVQNTTVNKEVIVEVNHSIVESTNDKKSEVTSIILVLLFGVFGLFYANSNKAIKVLFYNIGICILAMILFSGDDEKIWNIFILIQVIFYIISLILSNEYVRDYNNGVVEKIGIETNPDKDSIDKLKYLIHHEGQRSIADKSNKPEIEALINEICINEEETQKLKDEFYVRFGENIIYSIFKLTTDKNQLKRYYEPFMKYDLVDYEILDKINR